MNFNRHGDIEGLHAFLGASKYHWLNYSPEKLADSYRNYISTLKGTELHEFAKECIRLRQRLPKTNKTLNMYVNDAITYRMTPEQPLLYSSVCFGTADAISYSEKNKFLRIHDLKTGTTKAHIEQLLIYAGLFYLEYKDKFNLKLKDLESELRIYQNNEILYFNPQLEDLAPVVDKIISSSKIILDIQSEEL